MAHVLTVRVFQAWGVPDESDKNEPFVRVKILDVEGKVIQTQETTALTFGGDNPCWNENLNFPGLQDPALCTVVLEVRDKNDKAGEAPDGVAKVPLSVLLSSDHIQQFREKISGGWFSSAELRFGLCNFGTWGNNRRPENKLSVTIFSATSLIDADGGVGGWFASKNDPYVYVELKDEDGKALGKPLQTKVLDEAGENAEWNETLSFPVDILSFPQAYSLKLSVFDKDLMPGGDDCLGKLDFDLSTLVRKPDATEFAKELVDGKGAILKFAVSNEGTWGTLDESVLLTAPPITGLNDDPPHDGYYLRVNVLHADGLSSGSKANVLQGKPDPICRVTLRDESYRTIATVTTKPKAAPKPKAKAKAKAKPKATGKAKNRKAKKEGKEAPKAADEPDVVWNETFEFRGIHNPGRCTLALNVLDGDSSESSGKRLGEHVFTLGALDAKEGPQEFDEEIAGVFWKTTLKFQCENMGAWGNDEKPENNKLYIRIDEATNLPQNTGTIIKDVVDPYVFIELKDDEGTVIDKKGTEVKWNAGSNPKFEQELVFENIEEPAGCSIFMVVYDKEQLGQDEKLGHAEVFLGELPKTSEYVSYFGTTLGGLGELNFAMHTGGTWGNGTPVDVPEEKDEPPQCCSTM
jgi:hypothetical protein